MAKETESSSLVPDRICQRFSLDEVRSATENFDEALVIGRGGFGKVYKGPINNGSTTVVAMKRLHSMSDQGAPEFQAEVEMLSKLRHCNLVSLIGYCNDGREMVLVYDYMPHGTLEDRLHKSGAPLSWLQRLKICIGAARGLDYLHTGTGTQHGIIHRDVKTSNVLLDENFAAKISDFGLAKIGPINQTRTHVSTAVKGTFGYMDPCYFFTGKLTRKSDVYSFGVILLEVICGRPAVDTSLDEEQWSLATWAQDRIREGKLNQIIDSRLKGKISSNCLKDFARIACRCLHNQPSQRPTMAEIIAKLEVILSLQERLDSTVTEGKFIDKLRSFFPAKVQLKSSKWMSAHTASSEGEPSDKAAGKLVNATVTTGTAKVDLGHKDAPLLIQFDDAFSYTFEELLRADAELISESNYWTAARTTLRNGNQLMVKRLKKEFLQEENIVPGKIRALGKLYHKGILQPKACYYSKDEIIYITDYIQNGSVSSFLHSPEGQVPGSRSWLTRLRIIVGITRGLVYLHTHKNIVHGDLTSGNVLLDKKYNPLIADVGLLGLTRHTKPNSLNHAPELLKFHDANMQTDVYSLGLIMLELLTRKSTNSEKHEVDLPGWVMSVPREKLRAEVFDPELKRERFNIKQDLVRMLELAMACVSLSPNARPKAQEVLQQLEEFVPIIKIGND